MKEKSYAKINVALNVVKALSNGYHELDMINVTIRLHDTIKVKFNKTGEIKLSSNDHHLPVDDTNTVVKIIQKVKQQFKLDFGSDVYIQKRIAQQSGLGGGSGNAAAILKLLNKKFKLKMTPVQMINFVKPISSDAPYQLINYPSRVKKMGEDVKPFECKLKGKLFVIKPKSGNSTQKVFENLKDETMDHPNINKVERAMKDGNSELLSKHVTNSLLKSACELNKDIEPIIEKLKNLGFEVVSMSGSGSTCFAYSKNKKVYKAAKNYFVKDNYDVCKSYSFIK